MTILQGPASHNSVVIHGGIVTGFVTGDLSYSSDATNNKVSIYGNPIFTSRTRIIGGTSYSGDSRTGNTLQIFTSGITVGNIHNFEKYEFALPAKGSIGLTLKENRSTDFYLNDTISVPAALPGSKREVGDIMTLLKGSNLNTTVVSWDGQLGQAKQGVFFTYDYRLATSSRDITATGTGFCTLCRNKCRQHAVQHRITRRFYRHEYAHRLCP